MLLPEILDCSLYSYGHGQGHINYAAQTVVKKVSGSTWSGSTKCLEAREEEAEHISSSQSDMDHQLSRKESKLADKVYHPMSNIFWQFFPPKK